MNKSTCFSALASLMALFSASTAHGARDLVWLGSADVETGNNWDLVTANWYVKGDPEKARVRFESGDNVWFIDSEWVSSTVKMIRTNTASWTKEFDIGAIVISNESAKLTWTCNGTQDYVDDVCFQPTSIEKWGAGTLTTGCNFEWKCDYNVHQGEFRATIGSTHPYDERNELGSMALARTIRFMDGATYATTKQGFGGFGNGANLKVCFSNATFKVDQDSTFVSIPNAVFYNPTFSFLSKDADVCSVGFTGDAEFAGTSPITLPSNRRLVFGHRNGTPTTVTVRDVTGNQNDDLIVSSMLGNFRGDWWNIPFEVCNSFIKSGSGRMRINRNDNTMTGNVQVVEGTLCFSGTGANFDFRKSALGAVDGVDRTITVKDKGTIEMGNCCFGLVNMATSFKMAVEPGGTIKLCEGQNVFGQLLLNGGDFEYANGAQTTWIEYGLFSVGKRLSFTGNRVYDLNVRGNHNVMYLGFTGNSVADAGPVDDGHPHLTNLWSVVELESADITQDAGIDASIGLEIRDMVNICYPDYGTKPNAYTYDPWKWCYFHDGIKKTGPGTVRIYGKTSYTHTTEVAAGALVIDSSITASSGATVYSGAYLGGTGVVCAVTLKENAGIEVDATKPGHLKVPSIVTEGAASVKIIGAESPDAICGRALFEVTGKPATFDLSNWKVSYGGTGRTRGIVLDYDPSTGIVSASRSGLILLLK